MSEEFPISIREALNEVQKQGMLFKITIEMEGYREVEDKSRPPHPLGWHYIKKETSRVQLIGTGAIYDSEMDDLIIRQPKIIMLERDF